MFNRDEEPDSTGLLRFLEVIGPSLRFLTVDIATVNDLDENAILRSCPNVEELSLCHYYMDVHLNVREYRMTKQPIPELNCHWTDMEALIRELKDSKSSTSNCMRRLRLHLHEVTRVYVIAEGRHVDVSPTLDELLPMLEVNQGLEFLGIDILPVDALYLAAFNKFHHQPIGRMDMPLSLECKLAFLSAADSGSRLSRGGKSRPKRTLTQLDPHAASMIFAFAAVPVRRQVLYGVH